MESEKNPVAEIASWSAPENSEIDYYSEPEFKSFDEYISGMGFKALTDSQEKILLDKFETENNPVGNTLSEISKINRMLSGNSIQGIVRIQLIQERNRLYKLYNKKVGFQCF